MNELTHLDLFTGIGGFTIAAQSAGFRTVGFSEVEPYACRVLDARFPGIRNLGDIRKPRNFAGLGPVTVCSAGYPCQPASLLGKRKGHKDHRWLWPAAFDVVQVVRPAWFIGENVLGHVSMGLDQVLTDLESIGYAAQPFIIPACAVDAPHLRSRVWILAHTEHPGRQRGKVPEQGRIPAIVLPRETLPHPESERLEKIVEARPAPAPADRSGAGDHPSRWLAEPSVGRVADGIPHWAHRIKTLGNAIVWQVAENFFRWIAQIEKGEIA